MLTKCPDTSATFEKNTIGGTAAQLSALNNRAFRLTGLFLRAGNAGRPPD
ncbi:hypothetical protein D1AOALGA4SA_12617 [Olavius algarvensis Delta 1 endosymbiont]|nr:hypothetical protein D1AOALGA4SA_12617 [Olavius algarvensis Delta 1 endosymbiont]